MWLASTMGAVMSDFAINSSLQGIQRASQGITNTSAAINRASQTTSSAEPSTDRNASLAANDAARRQERAVNNPTDNSGTMASLNAPNQTANLVQLNEDQRLAEANIRGLRTADDMLGSIIDIRV